ncbi:uncharacterized protein LOC116305040 [Actinia tenebrosa]|uniref:Uncharacterized protein LOC116305040 n=1 Tax=Actinia tenebrosa TaxID=6105 RepID=A0A6P8IUV8_ACTTE|nr:uncharacterized protein LOC116305040 [Actinia tenebrosa]
MLCEGCSQHKLRKEFPHENVCSNKHAQLYCLRCVAKSIEQRKQCPACNADVPKHSRQYSSCIQKLNWLFPPFEDDQAASANESVDSLGYRSLIRNITVNVVMLNGDKKTIVVSRSTTIMDLKKNVSVHFGIDSKKQRLIYNDKSLESYKSNQLMKVSDYNIADNSTITLIKVLKTISDSLKHVTFDFHWNYVGYRRDYLNVSAILYSGTSRVDVVDFKRTVFPSGLYGYGTGYGAVTHSGHGFKNNWRGSRGNHKIEVNFDLLSATSVDKVFFTLSALNAGSIEEFRNLTLDFHDSRNPSEQLDEIRRAVKHHKAIVFCCLCRIDGSWQVFGLQEPSYGNVRDYYPLYSTIQTIILKGFS